MGSWIGLLIVLVLVLVNAFFVAAEFSLVSVRKTRIDERVARGDAAAKAVKRAIHDPDRFIAATQLGVTLASLGLGWIGEPALAHLFEPLFEFLPGEIGGVAAHVAAGGAVAFLLITGMHVVLGELMPKSLALQDAEQTALFVARPTLWAEQLFRPLIWVLNGAANGLLKLFKLRATNAHASLYSIEELKMMVDASQQGGVIERDEREMLHAVFDFGEMAARQVMVPRTEIVAVPVTATLDEVIDIVSQHLLTKFPVYERDLDHVVGILHVKDIVRVIRRPGEQRPSLRELMREVLFVPESVRVDDLLSRFRQRRQHIAILLDEYGGTAGLVTLEDLLEEIVGDVRDAFEQGEPSLQRQADGSVLINGLTPLEEFNDAFCLNLSDPNYETIAGYVMGRLDRIAKVGDEVDIPTERETLRLRVDAMDGLRIARIVLRRLPAANASADA